MNAGNEGVEKEHEDHHTKDGHTLHQENLVGYSVLWRRKTIVSSGGKAFKVLSSTDGIGLKRSFKDQASFIIEITSMHHSHSE